MINQIENNAFNFAKFKFYTQFQFLVTMSQAVIM